MTMHTFHDVGDYLLNLPKHTDMLEELFKMQYKFGKKFTDFDLVKTDSIERQVYTMQFIDHTMEELVELRRELPIRKDWSTKRLSNPNWDQALTEYVDALHFFISIALVNGWTAEDVFKAYVNKNKVNQQRQKDGY